MFMNVWVEEAEKKAQSDKNFAQRGVSFHGDLFIYYFFRLLKIIIAFYLQQINVFTTYTKSNISLCLFMGFFSMVRARVWKYGTKRGGKIQHILTNSFEKL